jgi:hypothetical protein
MSSRKSFCTHEPYINIENFNVERLEATKLLGNSGRTSSARKHFAMSPPPVELLSLRGQLRDTLIKNDESMCNLGRGDLNPLDGRLFTTESVANFIRQRLSDAKDDESPFRQTLSDWYIKSLECHNAVQLVHSLIVRRSITVWRQYLFIVSVLFLGERRRVQRRNTKDPG